MAKKEPDKMHTDITDSSVTYRCPTTQIDYKGACPVVNCVANISRQKRASGCIYNFLEGKNTFSAQDLAYVFTLSVREVKKRVENGKKNIQYTLLLNTLLQKYREKPYRHCSSCGVIRTTIGDCINQFECNHRKRTINKFLEHRPFSISELNFQSKDMFVLLCNRKLINKYLKSFDTAKQKLRLKIVLQVTNSEYRKLLELKHTI